MLKDDGGSSVGRVLPSMCEVLGLSPGATYTSVVSLVVHLCSPSSTRLSSGTFQVKGQPGLCEPLS